MPDSSPEIEEAIRQTVAAIASADFATIEELTSRDESVVAIGTDPEEWAEGFQDIMALMRGSTPEGEVGVNVGLDEVRTFREGDIGWAAARGYFELEGKRVPVRVTAVMRREDGTWKSMQSHASIGVPNEKMLDPMFEAR